MSQKWLGFSEWKSMSKQKLWLHYIHTLFALCVYRSSAILYYQNTGQTDPGYIPYLIYAHHIIVYVYLVDPLLYTSIMVFSLSDPSSPPPPCTPSASAKTSLYCPSWRVPSLQSFYETFLGCCWKEILLEIFLGCLWGKISLGYRIHPSSNAFSLFKKGCSWRLSCERSLGYIHSTWICLPVTYIEKPKKNKIVPKRP